MARAILKFPGAKWRMADWIISLMPPHKSYLEPFFGSGAVFFCKPPSRIETINDLDGDIINLFRVMRTMPEELARAVALTPYSRAEYMQAWERRQEATDPVERARVTLIRYWQAVGSRQIYRAGWRRDVAGREAAYTLRNWVQLPERIAMAADRLKDAQIEQTSAVELIPKFSSPDVLIYADPPYLIETRTQKQYNIEMPTKAQHTELLEILKKHPGPVILSGYDSPLYNDLLNGWVRLQQPSTAEGGALRTEVMWLNYEPQIALI